MGASITKSLTKYVYDKDRNVFCKLFCSRIEKEYPNLTELRKEIGDMVYDIDLVEYSPTQKELKDLHIDKLRLSSDYLESIGHYDPSFYDTCIKNNLDLKYYECLNSEIVTYDLKQLEMQNSFKMEKHSAIYYISDIHLDYKIATRFPIKASIHEVRRYIHEITEGMKKDTKYDPPLFVIIAGDVSCNPTINRIFFEELVKLFDYRQIVTILGNHEYWPSEFGSVPETIYSNYYRMLRSMRIAILQNDLLVLKDGERIAVREEELIKADVKEIREFCIGCSVLIYGGTAFSGLNADFNCNSGIYRNTITDRTVEGELSERFSYLYNKLLGAIPEFNLIVLSHTPKIDWTTQDYHPGWHYIHGHTHRNEFISENNVNVYSDNQIGYKNGSIHLKKFNLSVVSDIFIDYEDGIHNITIDQYRSFYRMLHIQMTFNGVDQIIMIKRSGYYCFLTKGSKGYRLLNGGKKQNIDYGPEYIYDNLQKYADNVNGFFEEYNNNIKQISEFVKSIGGSGRIHGCIVDVDYFNHIYYNPFDGKITTYFAYSIKEKYLYRNLRSLLYYKCPRLLVNYDLTTTSEKINSLIDSKDLIISEITEFVTDTEIYKISGIFKSFQYLTNHRIIRKWNERMISDFYSAIDIKDDINLLMEGM